MFRIVNSQVDFLNSEFERIFLNYKSNKTGSLGIKY